MCQSVVRPLRNPGFSPGRLRGSGLTCLRCFLLQSDGETASDPSGLLGGTGSMDMG